MLDEVDTKTVVIGEKKIESVITNGKSYAPLRLLLEGLYGEATKTRLTFDLVPLWDGRTIPCIPIILNGRSMVSVRDFANWQDLHIVLDASDILLKR